MMDGQARRKLKVDMDQLEIAFDDGSWEMNFYLDLQTGDVELINEDIRYDLERICDEIKDVDVEEQDAAFREALARSDLTEEDKVPALTAYQIEADVLGSRYLEVPPQSSRDGYRDMEEFIETIEDEQLQDRLWRAIDGRGAFRAFRNELYDHDEERQRWYAFRDGRVRERLLDWLAEEGIQPITE